MKILKPDHGRRIEIEGVPAPVRRPVDIDQEKTGFANLRTLRIYQFDPGSVIDGHAEEDELFIVLLSGSAELKIQSAGSEDISAHLSANCEPGSECAAYLPPNAAYRLVPGVQADVAYARATPVNSILPKIFPSALNRQNDGSEVLLDPMGYAEKLSLRLFQIKATQPNATLGHGQEPQEALLHVRDIRPSGSATIVDDNGTERILEAWDTVALASGEGYRLRLVEGSSMLALVVLAS